VTTQRQHSLSFDYDVPYGRLAYAVLFEINIIH